MPANLSKVAVLFFVVSVGTNVTAQPPGDAKGRRNNALDEDKQILREIREAYKAPFEVYEDVLKDLRRSYKEPSEKREASMFRELRRLYVLSPERELAILQEIRRAYELQSSAQEERLFREIQNSPPLPKGAVPEATQSEQAWKLFRRLDLDHNEILGPDEMPEALRGERRRWDSNRDGFINPDEYWAYYQGRLRWLSDEVAAGRIDLGLKRGGPIVIEIPVENEDPRPIVYRAGKLPKGLPPWFEEFDTDKDGQVALFEWHKGGNALKDFAAIDRDNDGLVTPEETLRFLAQDSAAQEQAASEAEEKKGKKKK
ncbi:MAG: hypothetical protein L0Y72_07815 [Gemmataceae bacterium]|nr:hypothetical protein [Gemmataceae bacterium]MCI0738935.1 hypothetical protein [Gemmataceae bacterium]